MTHDAGRGVPRAEDRPELDEDEIVRFLATRPDFLNRHPSLYLTLTPPARVHGEAVADHMAAMLGAARERNLALQTNLEGRRAGLSLRERVDQALLGLVRAADPVDWISAELAAILGIDAAHLCLEAPRAGARALRPGAARVLLQGRDVVLRDAPCDAALLHAEAAPLVRRDALVRVPLAAGCPGVLALGSRDARLMVASAEAPLALLGRAVAAGLERA